MNISDIVGEPTQFDHGERLFRGMDWFVVIVADSKVVVKAAFKSVKDAFAFSAMVDKSYVLDEFGKVYSCE